MLILTVHLFDFTGEFGMGERRVEEKPSTESVTFNITAAYDRPHLGKHLEE